MIPSGDHLLCMSRGLPFINIFHMKRACFELRRLLLLMSRLNLKFAKIKT